MNETDNILHRTIRLQRQTLGGLNKKLAEKDKEIRKLREERDAAVEGYREQVKLAGELVDKNTALQQAIRERDDEIDMLRLHSGIYEREQLRKILLTEKSG